MEYDRLKPTASARVTEPDLAETRHRPKTRVRFVIITGLILVLLGGGCVLGVMRLRRPSSGHSMKAPTGAIRKACGLTRYPELCMITLVGFPGSDDAKDPKEVAHISVNVTQQRFEQALSESTQITNWPMDSLTRSAYQDCLDLLQDSLDLLTQSLQGGSTEDVMTWLSGAMTNDDTCTDGLQKAAGKVKNEMGQNLKELSELVSNCLAIYAASSNGNQGNDFSGVPIQNRRRLFQHSGFPKWLSRSDRELLGAPTPSIQADIVVAQDGSGTVKTITEAIKKAPQNSPRRVIILVKAGTYAEPNLKVGRKKTNLWFLGEAKVEL